MAMAMKREMRRFDVVKNINITIDDNDTGCQ